MSRPGGRKALLAIASGVLTALAMPGFGLFPLVFVALVPLFFALEGRGGFARAVLFGGTFFALDLRWILTVTRFSAWVIPGTILLVAYFGAFTALFSLALKRSRADGFDGWLLASAPAALALVELARAQGPLGIGFSALYHALYRTPALVQAASVLGPWSITAGIVFVNAAIYLALRRKQLRYAFAALGGIAALAAFALVPIAPDTGEAVHVAVIASSVPQETKLDGRNLEALTERYTALGRRALAEDPDLVVFPESILPAYILSERDLLSRFQNLAADGQTRVLFGTGVYENREVYNTVALISEEGDLIGTYAMVRPVPFGEYVPARPLWEAIGLGRFVDSFLPLDLTPGEGFDPIENIGTPICFESTFPDPSRRLTGAGAEILTIVTNDAWFAGSSELIAHFSAAVFRAVETRRYVAQAANGGVSGLIAPSGRILIEAKDEGPLGGEVYRRLDRSLYARWGDLPLLALAGLACVISVGIRARDRKRSGG